MRKVLVLDANQRSALAIIRSLGRRGLEVVAGDPNTHSLGGASRYAASSVRYSDPALRPGRFVGEVIEIAHRLAIDTIIPATDLTTMLLLSQSELSHIARVATAPSVSYEQVTDKARLIGLAERLGVAVPETRVAESGAAITKAAQAFGYPLVLKPARSRYLKGDRVVSTSVDIVRDSEELARAVHSINWLADIPCLVQRFVPGHGAGVFALYGPSGPVAWFAHRRIREKPPAGGVSVLSESAPIDPALQSAAERILTAAAWTGVAMVEFRIGVDGTPYLMEVNGRFWGSLQLAIDSGIDFPWLLYQVMQGAPVTAPPPYELGRRLRWLLGDFDRLVTELRRSPLGVRHKAKTLGAFMRSFVDSRCQQEVLRLDDPRPGLAESRQWLQALIR
jgi:predicted ATP-grasp superfamily ATP-dependent carboligase